MSESKSKGNGPVNRSAVVAFVLAVFQLNVIALIVGLMALKRINREGQRGRGLARAAIILGGFQTFIVIWLVIDANSLPFTLGYIWGWLLELIGA